MKQTLIALAASAAMLTMSANAFACAQTERSAAQAVNQGPIQLAQAAGQGTTAGGSGQQNDLDKKLIGPKAGDSAGAPPANPAVNPPAGGTDSTDNSQSKRKGSDEPAQSGSK
jgi:hypothetical protein